MQVVIQQMVINYLLLLFLNIIAAFTVRALEARNTKSETHLCSREVFSDGCSSEKKGIVPPH